MAMSPLVDLRRAAAGGHPSSLLSSPPHPRYSLIILEGASNRRTPPLNAAGRPSAWRLRAPCAHAPEGPSLHEREREGDSNDADGLHSTTASWPTEHRPKLLLLRPRREAPDIAAPVAAAAEIGCDEEGAIRRGPGLPGGCEDGASGEPEQSAGIIDGDTAAEWQRGPEQLHTPLSPPASEQQPMRASRRHGWVGEAPTALEAAAEEAGGRRGGGTWRGASAGTEAAASASGGRGGARRSSSRGGEQAEPRFRSRGGGAGGGLPGQLADPRYAPRLPRDVGRGALSGNDSMPSQLVWAKARGGHRGSVPSSSSSLPAEAQGGRRVGSWGLEERRSRPDVESGMGSVVAHQGGPQSVHHAPPETDALPLLLGQGRPHSVHHHHAPPDVESGMDLTGRPPSSVYHAPPETDAQLLLILNRRQLTASLMESRDFVDVGKVRREGEAAASRGFRPEGRMCGSR